MSLPEGLRAALGQVIANERREWRRERELIEAQARATIAEVRAEVTERLAGLRDGKDGRDGLDGLDGKDGRDGVDGKDGADGRDGKDGAPGLDGARGLDGEAGKDGRDGMDGKDGADGMNGRDGADGRSLVIRGTWSESDAYQALDVVALNGSSFAARQDDPGPCPGPGWQLIASQGKRGQAGADGRHGTRGDPGQSGTVVVALDVDDSGLLTLTNSDGSAVTLDLYPLLSRIAR